MPEGDTITRAARRLHQALAGRPITRFETRARGHIAPGRVIESVEARGKHLLMHFDDGSTLHTHMRMTGSWHVYRAGERWQKSPAAARVVIEVDDGTQAVCFAAPLVEFLPARRDRRTDLDHLGPDLCRAETDIDVVLDRLNGVDPTREIGDVLLDQTVASGIGNVYKSEVCFALHVDPFTPVGTLTPDVRRELYATAAQLLRANLDTVRRTTVPGGLAVYGRAGDACRVCGTRIAARRQGPDARTTYWCPTCQHQTPRITQAER